jgi:hypothetical protein
MMVEAIIFAPTSNQTTRRILAMNAFAFAVDFLSFPWLVVGLSPGTFRIHAQLVIHLRVDLTGILETSQKVQPVPRSEISIIPAIEIFGFQRNQSQVMTDDAIDALDDAHDDDGRFSLSPNNQKTILLYTHLSSPSLPWRSQAQKSLSPFIHSLIGLSTPPPILSPLPPSHGAAKRKNPSPLSSTL